MKLSFFIYASLTLASLIRINDNNFKDVVINSGKYVLVDFYADWCRHCMNLMPAIEELSEVYAKTSEIEIVKINGDEDGRKMTKKYKVPGFPTLLLFHGDDKPIEYDGLRDAESIGNFIQAASQINLRKQSQELSPLVIQLSDYNFQSSVLRADHLTLVLFSAAGDKTSETLHNIWNNLTEIYANEEDKIRFGRVDIGPKNKALVKNLVGLFGISYAPMILFFDPTKIDPDGLKRPSYYSGELSLKAFSDFANLATGVSRTPNGALLKTAGRISKIDLLLKDAISEVGPFVLDLESQLENDGRDVLIQRHLLLPSDDISMLPYYKRAIGQYVQGGKEAIERESFRLKRMLADSRENMDSKAFDYMQKRSNILDSFLSS